jgi:hypothetical protein
VALISLVAAMVWGCGGRPAFPSGGMTDSGAMTDSGGPGAPSLDAAGGGSSGSGGAGVADAGAVGNPLTGGCPAPPPSKGGWVEVSPPPGQEGLQITGASTVGDNDIFFVGGIPEAVSNGSEPPQAGRILRWTDGCWKLELATPPSFGRLTVSATAPDDVWVTAGGVLYHRDAAGWSPFVDDSWRALVKPAGWAGLTDARALAGDELWAIGYDFVIHRTGGAWRAFSIDDVVPNRVPTAEFYTFGVLWVAGPNEVWIGASSHFVGSTMDSSSFFHFDGSSWTQGGHGYPTRIAAIWSAPGGDVWMAVPGQSAITGTIEPMLFRFADQQWTSFIVDGMPVFAQLDSLWGRAADDVWAAGDGVAHWDGRSWSLDGDAPAGEYLVTGDAGSVWLIGSGPRFFRLGRSP